MAANQRRTRLTQAVLGRWHLLNYIEADDRLNDLAKRFAALDNQIHDLLGRHQIALAEWENSTWKRKDVEAVEEQYLAIMEEEASRMVAVGFALIRSDSRISAAKFLFEQGHQIKFVPKSDKEEISMEIAGIPVSAFTSVEEEIAGGHGFSHLLDFDQAYQRFLTEREKVRELDAYISRLDRCMECLDDHLHALYPEVNMLLAAKTEEEATMKTEVDKMIQRGYVYVTHTNQLSTVKLLFEKGYDIRFIPDYTNYEIMRRAMLVRRIPITELPPES